MKPAEHWALTLLVVALTTTLLLSPVRRIWSDSLLGPLVLWAVLHFVAFRPFLRLLRERAARSALVRQQEADARALMIDVQP